MHFHYALLPWPANILSMQVVLVMCRPDGERRSFSLTKDITVIGRREDSDFRIPIGDVSRRHCRLIRDDQYLKLEDLGSSNGTYHNKNRVQEAYLQAGDTLQIGPALFVVQVDGIPADEDIKPHLNTVGSTTVAPPGEFDPMAALDPKHDSSSDESVNGDDLVIELEESDSDDKS